jgi:hypothetical protein
MKGKVKTVLARGSLEGTPVWGQRSADETNLQKASTFPVMRAFRLPRILSSTAYYGWFLSGKGPKHSHPFQTRINNDGLYKSSLSS